MKKIIIIGAGAIGRGYLPWVLPNDDYDLVFVDSNPQVVKALARGKYVTYRVRNGHLDSMRVDVRAALIPKDFRLSDHLDAVACFVCVGPRNVEKAAELMKGSSIPCVLCENEPNTVADFKAIVGHNLAYFAVPDVITSNTAPLELLKLDELSVVTEDGILFVDEALGLDIGHDVQMVTTEELIGRQWTAKLYLHNTPHCIAAYLGAYLGKTYLHEAMEVPQVDAIVQGAMNEMLATLTRSCSIPVEFLRWYADKELARFRCQLYDPVARVAREPLRKLEIHGRLIGAAQKCMAFGVLPANLLVGITAALLFEDKSDPDHYLVLLRQAIPSELFNLYILGLRNGESLDLMLRERMDSIIKDLESLSRAVI
jgi:hypothetical protein